MTTLSLKLFDRISLYSSAEIQYTLLKGVDKHFTHNLLNTVNELAYWQLGRYQCHSIRSPQIQEVCTFSINLKQTKLPCRAWRHVRRLACHIRHVPRRSHGKRNTRSHRHQTHQRTSDLPKSFYYKLPHYLQQWYRIKRHITSRLTITMRSMQHSH